MAGLEQEVQNLKKRLECCTQENSDIKKELSEAMTITVSFDFFVYSLVSLFFYMLFCSLISFGSRV